MQPWANSSQATKRCQITKDSLLSSYPVGTSTARFQPKSFLRGIITRQGVSRPLPFPASCLREISRGSTPT